VGLFVSTRPPNKGLLQTGPVLDVALTRLESSLVTSSDTRCREPRVARCRTAGRYTVQDHPR